MSLTLSARNTILPTLFPGTVYIALHTGNPGDTGSANELVDSSYARQPATFTIDSGTGTAALAAAIDFSIATTVTLTHISIWSAATGGTASNRQPLTAPVDVSSGTFTIAAGDITIGGAN
jgi:hypothetical protein